MLVPDGSESGLRQLISSVGHRHREDRPDTWSPSVPRWPLVVFTMPPHTTALLMLTHGDAVDPIPSAVQQPRLSERSAPIDSQLPICNLPCTRASAHAAAISCVIAVSGI